MHGGPTVALDHFNNNNNNLAFVEPLGLVQNYTSGVIRILMTHSTSSHRINWSTVSITQNTLQYITILLTTYPRSSTTTHLNCIVAVWEGLNTEKTTVTLVTIVPYLLTYMLYYVHDVT